MRTDFPATIEWLDQTAVRCARRLGLGTEDEIELLRAGLTEALAEFPQSALNNDVMTDIHGTLARERRESMSPEAWILWRHALQLHRMTTGSTRRVDDSTDPESKWHSASQAWFEAASGTTLNQPVRLTSEWGRPRDMVVKAVEVMSDGQDLTGYAVLTACVYRPPGTSDCQLYCPGARLSQLDWSELPDRAIRDTDARRG